MSELGMAPRHEEISRDHVAGMADEVGFEGFDGRIELAVVGMGPPMDLKVSTPMMPMTRFLSSRAASIATGPPIEWPTRMSCWFGTAASAVATSCP